MTAYGKDWFARYIDQTTRERIADLGPHEFLYFPKPVHVCDWQWWPYGPQGREGQQFCPPCGAIRPGVIHATAEVTR